MSIDPIVGGAGAAPISPTAGPGPAGQAGQTDFDALLERFERLHGAEGGPIEAPSKSPVPLAEPPPWLETVVSSADIAWDADPLAAAIDTGPMSMHDMLLFQHELHGHMLQLEVATKAASEGGSGVRQLFQQQV